MKNAKMRADRAMLATFVHKNDGYFDYSCRSRCSLIIQFD